MLRLTNSIQLYQQRVVESLISVVLFNAYVRYFMKRRIYLHWNLFTAFVFQRGYFFILGIGSLQTDVHTNSTVCLGEASQ